MHRPFDVLDGMLAHVLEYAGSFALYLIPDDARDGYATDRSERLQPSGDVDAFAIDVITVYNDIAKIDADAVADPLGFGELLLGLRGRLLYRQRTIDGGNHARELDQRPIAHELEYTPAMGSDVGVEYEAAIGLEALQRSHLVSLDEAAVADHVGRQYRGQFALHQGRRH